MRWDGALVGYVFAVYRALARALGAWARSHIKLPARGLPMRRWVNRDKANETFRPRTRSRVCEISSSLLLTRSWICYDS